MATMPTVSQLLLLFIAALSAELCWAAELSGITGNITASPASMLLMAETTSLDVVIVTNGTSCCRYALTDRPYQQMKAIGACNVTERTLSLNGLDPNPLTINSVYVRCAAWPADVMVLHYRSLPSVHNFSFPR